MFDRNEPKNFIETTDRYNVLRNVKFNELCAKDALNDDLFGGTVC
jgi:hypothetical protein